MVTPQSANCSVCGKTFTAKDANEDINPEEVKKAAEGVINSLNDASTNITNAIKKIEPDAEKAYQQNNKTIGKAMDDFCGKINEALTDVANQVSDANLYSKAVTEHDTLQTNYNNEASSSAQACAKTHETSEA
jgi:hypothetical protein